MDLLAERQVRLYQRHRLELNPNEKFHFFTVIIHMSRKQKIIVIAEFF